MGNDIYEIRAQFRCDIALHVMLKNGAKLSMLRGAVWTVLVVGMELVLFSLGTVEGFLAGSIIWSALPLVGLVEAKRFSYRIPIDFPRTFTPHV